jgi:hypothetical protein
MASSSPSTSLIKALFNLTSYFLLSSSTVISLIFNLQLWAI